ncbi:MULTISPECIES: hypothetical protein [Clostridium]|nr:MULTISPECIES: hypothetical protein [Clostridium]ACD52874.1 hypothetical protein CLH_1265 [Clostridium botulinum E3 str. Alaska E43]EES51284.1 hypothetical protein CLO_2449 [Clostridium botulinum E1 str. 'BoNT E Beluga']KAI3351005.1 hypothetical protein CIT18_00775 [Clostridium botulinum]MBY6760868.1 hypothetical protein [Clostridium botulinum]MBY6789593.1 hypothetical protein [Clostridium botulinum]
MSKSKKDKLIQQTGNMSQSKVKSYEENKQYLDRTKIETNNTNNKFF